MTDYTELQKAAAYAAQDTIKFADEDEEMRALQQFHEEVDPETVLALIAENERLKTLRSVTERDLAQELEVWRHGPSCWNCGDTGDVHDMVGEWLGQCDCNAAKLIDISSERDQLRAEVAGLKTGYEAYERVNAELKAEVEALRKSLLDAAEEIDAWGSYASDYFQEKHDLAGCVAKFHAAAMGKGEQS